MPVSLSKLAKDLAKFIDTEFSDFIAKIVIEELDANVDDEKMEKIIEKIKTKFDETYLTTKTTPRKSTPKKAKEPALSFEEYTKKYENNEEEKGCQWPITRGSEKGKVCGIPMLIGDEGYSIEDYNDCKIRCKACERNVGEKPYKKSKDWFHEKKIGNQVKGTPTTGISVPSIDMPVQTIGGVKEGIVSPTPENFVAGQDTGNMTPTKAKKKKSSPEKLKVKNIKHGKNTEEYSDFRSSSPYNGNIIMLRVHNEDGGRKTFGGKFDNLDDLDSESYLQSVVPLTEDDIEELKKYEYKYEYCGQSKDENIEDLLGQLSEDDSD